MCQVPLGEFKDIQDYDYFSFPFQVIMLKGYGFHRRMLLYRIDLCCEFFVIHTVQKAIPDISFSKSMLRLEEYTWM